LGVDNQKGSEVGEELYRRGYIVESVFLRSYPTVAENICHKLDTFGILICRSGVGMCIVANKFKGIRAVNGTSDRIVKRARRRNDCNVLCLGSDYMSIRQMADFVDIFCNTDYEGKSDENLDQIKNIERRNFHD